jgi:hypothetical protein
MLRYDRRYTIMGTQNEDVDVETPVIWWLEIACIIKR